MPFSLRSFVTFAVLALIAVSSASAEHSNSLYNRFSRWSGYGWSEGYHAHDARIDDEARPHRKHWLPALGHLPLGHRKHAAPLASPAPSFPWTDSPTLAPQQVTPVPAAPADVPSPDAEPIPAPLPDLKPAGHQEATSPRLIPGRKATVR